MVMQRATHPSPIAIAILRDHVESWRRDNRWSRETVAGDDDTEPTAAEIADNFKAVVEHGAQASGAVSQLLDGVHAGEVEHAEAKLSLMAATIQKARGLMARLIKRRK